MSTAWGRTAVALLLTLAVASGVDVGIEFSPSVVAEFPKVATVQSQERMFSFLTTVDIVPRKNMIFASITDTTKASDFDSKPYGIWSWKSSSQARGSYVQIISFLPVIWASNPVAIDHYPSHGDTTMCVVDHLNGELVCAPDDAEEYEDPRRMAAYTPRAEPWSPHRTAYPVAHAASFPGLVFFSVPHAGRVGAIDVRTGAVASYDTVPRGYNTTECDEWLAATPIVSDECQAFVVKSYNGTRLKYCAVGLENYEPFGNKDSLAMAALWCVTIDNSSPLHKARSTVSIASLHGTGTGGGRCIASLNTGTHFSVYDLTTGTLLWRRPVGDRYDYLGFAKGGGIVHAVVKDEDGSDFETSVSYYGPCPAVDHLGCDSNGPRWTVRLPRPLSFEYDAGQFTVEVDRVGPLEWVGTSFPQYIAMLNFWPRERHSGNVERDAIPILYLLSLDEGQVASRIHSHDLMGSVQTIGFPVEKQGQMCFRVLQDDIVKINCISTRCSDGYGIVEGGASRRGCVQCPPGTYLDPSGVGRCLDCPAHAVSTQYSVSGCTECQWNEYTNDHIACEACPEGLYSAMTAKGEACGACERNWCAGGTCRVVMDGEGPRPECSCDTFVYGDRCEKDYQSVVTAVLASLSVMAVLACSGVLLLICGLIHRQSQRSSMQYAELTRSLDENLAESKAVLLEFDKTRSRMEWELDFTKVVIKKRIGSGATAMVYLAVYEGQEVAVKEIIDTVGLPLGYGSDGSPDNSSLSESSLTLKREVDVLKALRHPHLLHCWGLIAKPPCIVMEYADGGSLADAIHGSGRLTEGRIQEVSLHIARGMAYLHSQNLIHRDLKPDNVLIVRGVAKVADFGITRKDSGMMTYLAGTVRYMAPEVMDKKAPSVAANGLAEYSQKVDVYSYGVLLWEMWHRKYPFFELEWESQVSTAVMEGFRPSFTAQAPLALRGLVEECWRQEPCERPSFSEIVERLGSMWTDAVCRPAK